MFLDVGACSWNYMTNMLNAHNMNTPKITKIC